MTAAIQCSSPAPKRHISLTRSSEIDAGPELQSCTIEVAMCFNAGTSPSTSLQPNASALNTPCRDCVMSSKRPNHCVHVKDDNAASPDRKDRNTKQDHSFNFRNGESKLHSVYGWPAQSCCSSHQANVPDMAASAERSAASILKKMSFCLIINHLLIIQPREAAVFAIELVHSPQQKIQAGICGGIFCTKGLAQGISPAAASCELLFQAPVPGNSAADMLQCKKSSLLIIHKAFKKQPRLAEACSFFPFLV